MTQKSNSQLLYEWLNIMDRQQENAIVTITSDRAGNLSIYTIYENPEDLKKQLKHLLFLLDNSKQLVNL